jgi:photosystem II Psb27 protein
MRAHFLVLACSVCAPNAVHVVDHAGTTEKSLASLLLGMRPSSVSAASKPEVSRREALKTVGGAALAAGLANAHQGAALADEEAAVVIDPPEPTTTKAPKFVRTAQFEEYKGQTNDYRADTKVMMVNMKAASQIQRGDKDTEKWVPIVRVQMTDYLSNYRAAKAIAGSSSFSTMYDCINILAGHYTAYGNKYPLPAKRRERLEELFKQVDRALARTK